MCTSFQCLFSAFRLLHSLLQLGQVLIVCARGALAGGASSSSELLGPPEPTPPSGAATGSACQDGRWVALPWGLYSARLPWGLLLLFWDPSVVFSSSTYAIRSRVLEDPLYT